jgi:3-hydroxybutyryl-CoA dehydrogenase
VKDIHRVAVVGSGIMGEGIAQSFASAGFSVRAIDQEEGILSRCLRQIESNLNLFQEFGLITEEPRAILGRIETSLSKDIMAATADCQVVIECIPEILALKRELFARLDACAPTVILASNTSNFTITAISEGMATARRVAGLHYFNPAHIMPLVEIHRGRETTDEVVETLRELMIATNKMPILIRKEIAGFAVNRIQAAMGREASSLVEQGVISPEDLDRAAKASYGFRLACTGPMEQQDLSGLDTISRGMQEVYKTLSCATEPISQIKEKVARGELGVKSGKGWYDYHGRTRAQILDARDRKLLRQLVLYRQVAREAP